jgi:hypothetical protein
MLTFLGLPVSTRENVPIVPSFALPHKSLYFLVSLLEVIWMNICFNQETSVAMGREKTPHNQQNLCTTAEVHGLDCSWMLNAVRSVLQAWSLLLYAFARQKCTRSNKHIIWRTVPIFSSLTIDMSLCHKWKNLASNFIYFVHAVAWKQLASDFGFLSFNLHKWFPTWSIQ